MLAGSPHTTPAILGGVNQSPIIADQEKTWDILSNIFKEQN